MMTSEETETVNIEEFTQLPVELPPILMKMIGYPASARYVALYYYGSKATWNDGRALATFSYYNVYDPLKEHPAMVVHLYDAHLGSDDAYPTHALLCDREERKFLVGDYEKAVQFVRQQHNRETVAAAEVSDYASLLSEPQTASDFRRLGMFEIFMVPDAQAEAETISLQRWLDTFITEELVNRLLKMIDEKDYRAWPALSYIKRLVEAAQNNQVAEGGQQ